jgi:Predicted periplasmic protein
MKKPLVALLPSLVAPAAFGAGDLRVTIEIPRLNVAEYHRPYVAAWIAKPDNSVAANLNVWYAVDMANGEGATWLKDLRLWWRRSGRSLALPIDGVSGATRAPGEHALVFKASDPRLAELAPGEYQLVVEASREVGGREVVSVPFTWGNGVAIKAEARGENELGRIGIEILSTQ